MAKALRDRRAAARDPEGFARSLGVKEVPDLECSAPITIGDDVYLPAAEKAAVIRQISGEPEQAGAGRAES